MWKKMTKLWTWCIRAFWWWRNMAYAWKGTHYKYKYTDSFFISIQSIFPTRKTPATANATRHACPSRQENHWQMLRMMVQQICFFFEMTNVPFQMEAWKQFIKNCVYVCFKLELRSPRIKNNVQWNEMRMNREMERKRCSAICSRKIHDTKKKHE